MKAEWIVRKGNTDLLLFFNGWGMDRRVADWLVSAWPDSAGRDIAVLYDYRNLSIPAWLGEVMAEARAVDLVAWSLGVWAAVNSELEKSTVPWRSTARQRHSMRSEAFRRRFSQARSKAGTTPTASASNAG